MTELNQSLISRIKAAAAVVKTVAVVQKATSLVASWTYSSKTIIFSAVQTGRTKLEYATGLFFLIYLKIIGDTTNVSDLAAKSIGKGTQDTANISESDSIGVVKSRTDTANISESDSIGVFKNTQDIANISDSLLASIGFLRSTADTANIASSGLLVAQNYTVDNNYFEKDFVGQSAIIT